MIKIATKLLIMLLSLNFSYSKVITVGQNMEFERLGQASTQAQPGDTILLLGEQITGEYIANLKGTPQKPITIMGEESNFAQFNGGNTAIQFSKAEYIHLKFLSFDGQGANGLNIDDGGEFGTAARGIIIENCIWWGMNATGNNDCLKMSGVDNFEIRNSIFLNGALGGSMIDMVGCHNGIIEECEFRDAGSNCIQAKGGCSDVVIRRNEFIRGGQRSINIGGSTGMEFFRPDDAPFESSRIIIHSNIFWGSVAPVAFVGTTNSVVNHNTFINPEKWCIRILQENNHERLAKCSNNTISNNIFYFADVSSNPIINIGPNTLPETFEFRNNLWYNYQIPDWNNLNLPSAGINQIVGQNPMFQSLVDSILIPLEQSPAVNQADYGILSSDTLDYSGKKFNSPSTIGAIETNSVMNIRDLQSDLLKIYPQPSNDYLVIELRNNDKVKLEIYDLKGTLQIQCVFSNMEKIELNLESVNSGKYLLKIYSNTGFYNLIPIVIVK